MFCVLFPPELRHFGVKFMANRLRLGGNHFAGEILELADRNREIFVQVGLLNSKTDSCRWIRRGF
jgi:hypothetical protein